MKKIRLLISTCAGIAATICTTASAQTNASDNAAGYTNSNPGNTAWMYQGTVNGGFGFQPWVFRANNTNSGTGNGGFAGFFIAHGTPIDTATNAWGMYANGDGVNYALVYRGFSNSLATSNVFTVKFKNAGIDNGTFVGFSLRNGTSTNFIDSTVITDSGTRFSFYFQGGGANYLIWDGRSEVIDTGVPYTANGRSFEFYLLTANTYRLVIKSADGSTTVTNMDSLPLAGSGTIDSFVGYAFDNNGGDIHFNSLGIVGVSTVPPTIVNLIPANGSIYVTTNQLSFDVLSPFSGVTNSGISMVLNGVTYTNFTVTGTATNRHAVWNTALQPNVVYTGAAIAEDISGNRATNNFSFNTWITTWLTDLSANIFVEAEDYNFNNGIYIPQAEPNDYGTVVLPAVAGVDFVETDDVTNNAYRTQDIVDLDAPPISADVDHADFAANLNSDYDLSYVGFNEWVNYTRELANTNYAVYARMASLSGDPTMQLDRTAASTATSSNQARATLGTFVCPADTGGSQSYTFVPLKDFFSNPVQIRFAGVNTFRTTRIGGSYNLNYLILVRTTNTTTLRPYISSGYPYPGVGGVVPDSLISFTIANRQTAVVPGSIQLFVNNVDVTGSTTLSNNAAGTVVRYQTPTLFAFGSTNTIRNIFSDGSVSQTNNWQFTVGTLLVISSNYCVTGTGTNAGFNVKIAKAPDTTADALIPFNIERVETHLAGLLTNELGQPLVNEAGGPSGNGLYNETNTINYEQCGANSPDGEVITNNMPFPYVTNSIYSPCANTNGPELISMSAVAYVELQAGTIYKFGVSSDDGFRLTAGADPNPTNVTVMEYLTGRSSGTPSETEFMVEKTGLYPFRLTYFEGKFGASVEFFSRNRTNGTAKLINDGSGIKAWRGANVALTAIPLTIQRSGNNVVVTWGNPAFALQAAPLVKGTYTNVLGATSPYTNGISGSQTYYRLIN